MTWNAFSADEKDSIIRAAATRVDQEALAASLADAPDLPANAVSVADLADFARGRAPARVMAAIRFAVRTDARTAALLSRLLDLHAGVRLPLAAAASSGEVMRRRIGDRGVEMELVASTADPSVVFVRLEAPAALRPLKRLLAVSQDGEVAEIALSDDGDSIEAMIARDSLEYRLLTGGNTQLWLN